MDFNVIKIILKIAMFLLKHYDPNNPQEVKKIAVGPDMTEWEESLKKWRSERDNLDNVIKRSYEDDNRNLFVYEGFVITIVNRNGRFLTFNNGKSVEVLVEYCTGSKEVKTKETIVFSLDKQPAIFCSDKDVIERIVLHISKYGKVRFTAKHCDQTEKFEMTIPYNPKIKVSFAKKS